MPTNTQLQLFRGTCDDVIACDACDMINSE